MAHTIADPTKMTVNTVTGTHATIGGVIETFLQTLTAGDDIVEINIVKKSHGNNFIAYITWENQQIESSQSRERESKKSDRMSNKARTLRMLRKQRAKQKRDYDKELEKMREEYACIEKRN